MDEEEKGLYTVAEAAEAWGISTQAIYQRLHKLQRQGFVVVQGKKRYITSEGIEAHQQENQQVAKQVDKDLPTLQEELATLKAALLAEQGKASSLQATVTAQEAHIETLKQALEKEQTNTEGLRKALDQQQALHMASLQKRLPAPGRGFFAWLRGMKGEE